jgi:hypothetical protein
MAPTGRSPRTDAHPPRRTQPGHVGHAAASARATRRKHIELTTEMVILIVGPAGPAMIIGLLTGKRASIFVWACAAVATLVLLSLVYRRHRPDSRFFRRPRLAGIAIAVVAAASLSAARYYQPRVHPASACTPAGTAASNGAHKDPRTHISWPMVYYCPTPDGGLVYQYADAATRVIGNMGYDNPSWVVCYKRGADSRVWYYTEGASHAAEPSLFAWGFIPASVISAPSQPVPPVPACPPAVP